MAISVEEIITIALGRFKDSIDAAVEEKVAPFLRELDKRVEEARAQGAALMREQVRKAEVVEAEIVEIGKGKR